MKADIPPGPLADDVDLIIAQSARCRAILAKLRSLRSGDSGDPFAEVLLGELLEEVVKPLEGLGKSIFVEIPETLGEPVLKRNVGLLYGLGNLIENATQFARDRVTVEASWDRASVGVIITDDGPGFPDDLITRLGEPYLTTPRPQYGAGTGMRRGGSGSASSSPRRCWSEPVQSWRSRTLRRAAPGSESSGRAVRWAHRFDVCAPSAYMVRK